VKLLPFLAPKIFTIDNGTILSVNATNNGSIYPHYGRSNASGDITLQIEADKVFDLIGLGNLHPILWLLPAILQHLLLPFQQRLLRHSNIVSFDVDIDFSEAISGFDAGDISVENGPLATTL
jgi:hypothetical protein